MEQLLSLDYLAGILSTIIYMLLGLAMFILSYVIVDKLTHFSLHEELVEKQNRAVAIVIGSMLISLAVLVSGVIGS
ncbi:MAG: DUF350 domain-containing protein [Gammaproteobacteria bacterium]|nr:DUF350 domain-containing protein [Gammaproteobacteria bacterium]